MTFGLVELAVGVILVLVPGPGVSRGLSLFGIDSVVVLALDVFSLVPCELVCIGCGGSWPAFRPAPLVLPNSGFLLPRSWVFRRTRPAEQTGFAFFLGGCQHRRPSDQTGRLYPGRCA
ncbi:hypothetical protein F2Q68_00004915 [Brassica cretica]|uniref:Uncharacterized protein n=1 Tax=Brassica cretica TaxID=69181 RepID=A0A8S9J8D5_BRACR|nr:hypothetical protein F2Q68_00004915 [Brassica cretica]